MEKVPPGQIRQKALLDLSSKTATFATHAADPMYYPLYVANKWVDPLDTYLNDPTLTDKAWFNYDDIIKAWREADSVGGKPYGIPFDGEVTVQVYRKDLYAAKGLKPAETYDQLLSNAKALTDPANRTYGLALRGFSGAGQNMYVYPSILRGFGGSWFNGDKLVVNSPEAVKALEPFCGEFLYTHVDNEGLMQGTDMEAIMAVHRATSRRLTAAGGITTRAEIDALEAEGIDAVVGMAIYTGQLALD